MKWYDVTLPLQKNMPSWPGDKPFSREVTREISEDNPARVSHFCCSNHFGTHMDAPSHFLKMEKP